jgi:hypothetical protein
MTLQPGELGAFGEQQIARESERVDAEARLVLPQPPDRQEPVVAEEQVVRVEGLPVVVRIPQPECQSLRAVEPGEAGGAGAWIASRATA